MKKIISAALLCCLTISTMVAQDKMKIEIKEEKKPDVYIDGKRYDYAIFELLDQDKIASVFVVKDIKAQQEYNAPNGVILVKTKSSAEKTTSENGTAIKIKSKYVDSDPMVIIDGKVADKATLDTISPDTIESINVFKGQTALDLYDAPNGVIVVKTKE